MTHELKDLIEDGRLDANLLLEDIPDIDLYMDQVIQLFEQTFSPSTRNEEEKILTKTMINNYAKGKLLFPIKNKKYSKEHIMLISIIYTLKGALSINDIKSVLTPLHEQENAQPLETIYSALLQQSENNISHVKMQLDTLQNDLQQLVTDNHMDEQLHTIIAITSLVQLSNLYRKLAERLLDENVNNK